MKIVVIGASGASGTLVSDALEKKGHEVVRASRSTGVDLVTGEGVDEALQGADVVVELTNPPSFEPEQVEAFFKVSSKTLADAAAKAGVAHHVMLSIIGVGRPDNQGFYMRAKEVQEAAVRGSGVPFTIVWAAQFFEFIEMMSQSMVEESAHGKKIVAPGHAFQPVALAEVADYVAEIAEGPAQDAVVEIAGPDRLPMPQAIREVFQAKGEQWEVEPAEDAPYFGAPITDDSLVPHGDVRRGAQTLREWLAAQG